MAILPIRVYPDPMLRLRCQEVTAFDAELSRLAADMVETMHAAPGVGLAAPQVGTGIRLAVVDLSVGEDAAALHVLVNPELVAEEGRESEVEGCLSLPGISEKVERARAARIRFRDLGGETRELAAEGWLARTVLHEMDHLYGVLIVDRLRGLRRERARRLLKKLGEPEERAWDAAGSRR